MIQVMLLLHHPHSGAKGVECLTGREQLDWDFIEASDNGLTPVPAAGFTFHVVSI